MPSPDRPNVLLLMTDQHRPDAMGCYGNPLDLTPNLDALGREGAVFDNCYVQNPLCCPSRYSLLTGRYPHAHGVRANWYAPRPGETSFGHRLGRAGYRTSMIGKMHLTPWHDNFGFDGRVIAEPKFDRDVPDDYQRFLQKHGWDRSRLYDTDDPAYIHDGTATTSKLPQELHIDAFVGRGVCEYLRRVDGPFCCVGSFLSPHNPYDPPAPYDELYRDAELPPRNMTAGEVGRKPREAYDYINKLLGWPTGSDGLSDEQVRRMKASYYATCTLVDDWVGRIVEVLKEQSQYENTLIVYTSDHGDLLGDHGLLYKQCFYEQSVRVPLIVHAPKMVRPQRVKDLVEQIDLFSTFCDAAGASEGDGRQGRSLMPLLRGELDGPHREAAFSENWFGRMARSGDHKLVYYPGKPHGELYDLVADPDEQENLWDDPAAAGVKARLKGLLLDWAFTSEDPLPKPVRPSHFDAHPRHLHLDDGGRAAEDRRQAWYLEGMEDLYEDWAFSEPGKLR